MVLRRVVEEAMAHRLELHMVFVDFKKAFDGVSRSVLQQILAAYGVPSRVQYACVRFMKTPPPL